MNPMTNQTHTRKPALSSIGLHQCMESIGLEIRAGHPSIRHRRLPRWQLVRLSSYIQLHLHTTIRIRDLAAVAHLSVSYFSRIFRLSTGIPPHRYIMQSRLDRAQLLMTSTDLTLARIASECGLSDQAHLARMFREILGECPAAWRRARQMCQQPELHPLTLGRNVCGSESARRSSRDPAGRSTGLDIPAK